MGQWLYIPAILLPALSGAALCCGFIRSPRAQTRLCLFALAGTLGVSLLIAILSPSALPLFSMTGSASLVLFADGVSKLFLLLFSAGALFAGVFGVEYMAHQEHRGRFYGFYLLSLAALNGLALSENLITMYLFFELATLLSMPLVLHEATEASLRAAQKYLYYSIAGGFLALLAILLLFTCCQTPVFIPGGTLLPERLIGREGLFYTAMFLGVVGFGAKAGLFPLHGWLPAAHPVAPAPASALLSGLAAKAGVIAIVRLIYYSAGPGIFRGTWVQSAWIWLSLITILMGSMMADREDALKKRLAYSTVSQISYALLGLFLLSPEGLTAGLMHTLFHACIKICLFLCAGAIMLRTGRTRVSQMRGVGKELPWTIWAFTLSALALIGIPPFCGFVSKWALAEASLLSGLPGISIIAPVNLLFSALLTAAYLLPVTVSGFFPGKDYPRPSVNREGTKLMTLPVLALAILSLGLGMFPNALIRFLCGIAAGIF